MSSSSAAAVVPTTRVQELRPQGLGKEKVWQVRYMEREYDSKEITGDAICSGVEKMIKTYTKAVLVEVVTSINASRVGISTGEDYSATSLTAMKLHAGLVWKQHAW